LSPTKLILEFNPHCEVGKGQKLNPTTTLRGGSYGRGSGLDKVIKVEPLWLDSSDFLRRETRYRQREREWEREEFYFLTCDALQKTISKNIPLTWTITWDKINLFSLYLPTLWYYVISNRKKDYALSTSMTSTRLETIYYHPKVSNKLHTLKGQQWIFCSSTLNCVYLTNSMLKV
jgi:hypothetical protein